MKVVFLLMCLIAIVLLGSLIGATINFYLLFPLVGIVATFKQAFLFSMIGMVFYTVVNYAGKTLIALGKK